MNLCSLWLWPGLAPVFSQSVHSLVIGRFLTKCLSSLAKFTRRHLSTFERDQKKTPQQHSTTQRMGQNTSTLDTPSSSLSLGALSSSKQPPHVDMSNGASSHHSSSSHQPHTLTTSSENNLPRNRKSTTTTKHSSTLSTSSLNNSSSCHSLTENSMNPQQHSQQQNSGVMMMGRSIHSSSSSVVSSPPQIQTTPPTVKILLLGLNGAGRSSMLFYEFNTNHCIV